MGLFKGAVDVPPIFIDQLAHVILRNVLDGFGEPLRLRAAELFFREQKATIRDGHALLADLETVQMHASGSRYGSIGKLMRAQARSRHGLDVRDSEPRSTEERIRHDTVISVTTRPSLDALCSVLKLDFNFFEIRTKIKPIRKIDELRWAWHVGLDAESTAILNELWAGGEIDAGRMRHVLALFSLQFEDPAVMRPDIAGRTVYLGLSADDDDIVRMKPQNLLTGLPIHEA